MKQSNRLLRFWPWIVVIALGSIAGLAYMQKQRDASKRNAPERDLIRIGLLLSLTGENANYGNRSLHGAQWATSKINEQGGIYGKRVELVISDTRSSPKDAVSAFHKLVDSDGLKVIVGDIISGTTLAVAPLAEHQRILLFAPGASNPKLTTAGEYIFRNWTSDEFDGSAMADYIHSKDIKKVAVVVEKSDYTMGLANAFKRRFTQETGEVVVQLESDPSTLDFRAIIERVRAAQPTAVYVSAYSAATGRILKQAKEGALQSQFFATLVVDTPECRALAGEAIEGVTYSTPAIDLSSSEPYVKEFVDGFESRFGDKPEETAAHAYDAMMMLRFVWPQGGPATPEALRDGLLRIRDYQGITGKMSMDQNGDVVKPINIKQIVNGEPRLIQTISPGR